MVCSLRYRFFSLKILLHSLKYIFSSLKVMLCSLKTLYSDRIEGTYHQEENRPIKVWNPLFDRFTQFVNGALTPINCCYVFNICNILCKIGCVMYILRTVEETRDHAQHKVSFETFPCINLAHYVLWHLVELWGPILQIPLLSSCWEDFIIFRVFWLFSIKLFNLPSTNWECQCEMQIHWWYLYLLVSNYVQRNWVGVKTIYKPFA